MKHELEQSHAPTAEVGAFSTTEFKNLTDDGRAGTETLPEGKGSADKAIGGFGGVKAGMKLSSITQHGPVTIPTETADGIYSMPTGGAMKTRPGVAAQNAD